MVRKEYKIVIILLDVTSFTILHKYVIASTLIVFHRQWHVLTNIPTPGKSLLHTGVLSKINDELLMNNVTKNSSEDYNRNAMDFRSKVEEKKRRRKKEGIYLLRMEMETPTSEREKEILMEKGTKLLLQIMLCGL